MTKIVGRLTSPRACLVSILLLATAAAVWMGGHQIVYNYLSFDGGMNAQMARNLIEHGRYATHYGSYRDFDHRVTTGPTVVLPTALSFGAFGVSTFTAQLTSLMYFIALFVLGTLFAYRHAGPIGSLLALLLIAATPQLLVRGLELYGEVPALAFLLAGLLVFELDPPSRPGFRGLATGVFLGLAVLTKVYMLLPISALGLVLLLALLRKQRISGRWTGGMAAGFVVPLAAFELPKLVVLSPAGYLQWWDVLARRAVSQGLPSQMEDTPGVVSKLNGHLGILGAATHIPVWLVVLILLTPWLLLLVLRRRPGEKRGRAGSIPVWFLASASLFHATWWLVSTPTSRAWYRRVFVGFVLQELLISIVLVWAVATLVEIHKRRGQCGNRLQRASIPLLAALLTLSTGVLVTRGLPDARPLSKPLPARQGDEVVAHFLRGLPRRATFYGEGWWQSPVLATLSGRWINDLDDLPLSRMGVSLDQTYLVIDRAFASMAASQVRETLDRVDSQLVCEAGGSSVYRLIRVLPYPPIPKPASSAELLSDYQSDGPDYPFAAGLGSRTPTRTKFSRAVSGYLLRRGHYQCLLIDTWVLPKAGYRPVLQVRVDGMAILSTTVPVDRRWRKTLRVNEGKPDRSAGSLVELWLYRDTPRKRYSLWHSRKQMLIVREVGFVTCPESVSTPSPLP